MLLFGGVYSNFQALQALYDWTLENDIDADQIVCTGDVVGYCAQPQECADFIEKWGVHCIPGNVEIQLRNGDEDCGCNFNEESSCDLHSRNWYPFAKKNVNEKAIEWMHSLPLNLIVEFGGKKWGVVHGSQEETARFVYKSSPWSEKLPSYDALGVDHILAGHCGVPFFDSNADRIWLNSGALGMPANDGTRRTWFSVVTFENDGFSVEFHSLESDFELTRDLMSAENLPKAYVESLKSGIWDSTEVLNETEALMTGEKLDLEGVVFKTERVIV